MIPGGIDPLDAMELPFGGTSSENDFLRMQEWIINHKALTDCGIEQFVVGR